MNFQNWKFDDRKYQINNLKIDNLEIENSKTWLWINNSHQLVYVVMLSNYSSKWNHLSRQHILSIDQQFKWNRIIWGI